jgi:hypothetical protein
LLSLLRAPSWCDMLSSIDRLVGAAAVGWSGAAAPSMGFCGVTWRVIQASE